MKLSEVTTNSTNSKRTSMANLHQTTSNPLAKVKQVQITMGRIDVHLNETYKKLNRSRQKRCTLFSSTSPIPSNNISEQMLNKQSDTFGSIDNYHSHSNLIKDQQQIKWAQNTQQITLINNRDVMEYIKLVYQIYNIPDPLRQMEGNILGFNSVISTSKKEEKNDCYEQIKSETKIKHQLTNWNTPSNSSKNSLSNKSSRNSTKKKGLITLVSQTSNTTKISKSKSKNPIILRAKSDKQNSKSITFKQTKKVAQVFRYCFMCEQPILECNILHHQQICQPLKQAYNYSTSQIIRLLDQKIDRFTARIQRNILDKGQLQINYEFDSIKHAVQEWMNEIQNDNMNKSLTSSTLPLSERSFYNQNTYRNKFETIEQNINRSICKEIQIVHKLNWFTKLRENVVSKYNIF